MKYTYRAIKKDIDTIEEGIKTVFSLKLSFIFNDKSAFEKFLIISYDSQNIYCWTTENLEYNAVSSLTLPHKRKLKRYVIPHNIQLTIQDRMGWHATVYLDGLDKIIPKELLNDITLPKMSGSLLGDFNITQKAEKGEKNNPYIYREGYLATIIHEFGHLYYNQVSHSVKTRSLKFLEQAKQLYSGKIPDDLTNPFIPYIPAMNLFYLFGEVFAICSENYASSIYYPEHKKRLSSFFLYLTQDLIKQETEKNSLFYTFDFQYYHTVASALGKIYMSLYPSDWPDVIINYPNYFPNQGEYVGDI